jgi:hypothetical protein
MLVLTAVLAGAGCGELKIELSVDKSTISAGGIEKALITAIVKEGDTVKTQAKVTFETSSGSFDNSGSLTYSERATDGTGKTTIDLYSAPAPGQATVTASHYDDASGITATSTIAITFTKASGTAAPVDGKLRLTCDAVNIGALREPVPDIKVTCDLEGQTRDGRAIKANAMTPNFRMEAGSMTTVVDSYSGATRFEYSPRGGNSAPKDVPPDPSLNEKSYNDRNGLQRNPRDGLVTIVAIVDGEEQFNDQNGNGEYDGGEPFVDATEPFVDENDNDKWDNGEPFVDTNSNGRWDPGNGVWDANTKIMAIYKILWTGKLDVSPNTSRLEAFVTTIPDSGKADVTAYVLDINMNPIAAFTGNSDYFEWSLTSGGDAYTQDATQPPLSNSYGFQFNKQANTERKRWTILPNTFEPQKLTLTVEDGYPQDGGAATTYSVTGRVYATPGPNGEGYFLTQQNEALGEKVEGTCD